MRKPLECLFSLALLSVCVPFLSSCEKSSGEGILSPSAPAASAQVLQVAPESVARLLSELPLTVDQVREVWDGVNSSSSNGYDEEYTFRSMLSSPGSGVGDDVLGTRASTGYSSPLGVLVATYVGGRPQTRAGNFLDELSLSGLQIYWPYSEGWDGRTLPVITFLPENEGAESNLGFYRESLPDGSWIVKEMMVSESYAMSHPVWVVNYNQDAGAMTPQMLGRLHPEASATRTSSGFKTLKLKEFKAHRQYDPWLAEGSEFFIKCGSLKAFTADVVADLSTYSPEITDLMIKVKRSQVGKALRYNTIVVSDWSSQLDECAFMMTEDDGGKMTSWKSSGKVMIKSKSYGFEVEIPYHRNDDIVWRGKLSAGYFEKYNGSASRYGDVSVTFTFD